MDNSKPMEIQSIKLCFSRKGKAKEILESLDCLWKSINRHKCFYRKQYRLEPLRLEINKIEDDEGPKRILVLPNIFNLSWITFLSDNTAIMLKEEFVKMKFENLHEIYGIRYYNRIFTVSCKNDLDEAIQCNIRTNGAYFKYLHEILLCWCNSCQQSYRTNIAKIVKQAPKSL